MDHEHVFDDRAGTQEAEVLSINDTGQAMTATVQTSSGAVYSDVEVVQSYGVGSNLPVDGALAILFALGGDPANMRAILYNPSLRYGNQQPGESTLYAPDGTRVSVRVGGVIDIKGGNQINIVGPHVTINAATVVSVNAPTVAITSPDVTVEGTLNVGGDIVVTAGSITVGGMTVTVP